MPGLTLGIGETNPKKGAVQYDGRRIDGVPFVIPSTSEISSAPVGSIVTLQEYASIGQKIVLGANAYTDGSGNTYSILAIGFLEAATQTSSAIDQTVGSFVTGDMVAMISDIDAVAMVPMVTNQNPTSGTGAYVDYEGRLSNESASSETGNVAFPGVVFFSTPGVQVTGQLKSGYCFAKLTKTMIG